MKVELAPLLNYSSSLAKLHHSPSQREVHIHNPLRTPYPVIFGVLLLFRIKTFGQGRSVRWNTNILPVHDFMLPLNS